MDSKKEITEYRHFEIENSTHVYSFQLCRLCMLEVAQYAATLHLLAPSILGILVAACTKFERNPST